MFVTAAYVTPWLLGVANCIPRSTEETAIELSLLGLSLIFGYVGFILLVKLIASFLVDVNMFVRWEKSVESLGQQNRGPTKIVVTHISWALKPLSKNRP